MKKYINIKNNFVDVSNYISLITISCLIIIWQIITTIFQIKDYILPSPLKVLKVILSQYHLLFSHTLVTLYEAILGFVISIIVALILSFVMSISSNIKKIVYPLLLISQTIPIIALAPIILIWFGVSILPKIIIVVLVCFFPVCVNTIEGLESSDKDMINLLKTMGANKFTIFKEITLPSALPQFFAGLKISATYSVMGAIIGEWLGAKSGLGIYMTRAMSSFRTDMLFASIIIIIFISILFFKITEVFEMLCIPWNIKIRKKEN